VGRVCKYCYLQARLRTGSCAGCGALTSLPGLNTTGQPACPRCGGIPARFRCGCGREVTAGERGRCWWCVLAELVTDVLAGPGEEVPAHLRPLADGLVSMRRPQSGVAWLRRSTIACQTLRDLAHGRLLCSHAALDAVGTSRAVEYLRCLLVRYGVLPPRDRRLADFQRWAAAKLDGIGNAGHRQLLERFLRWYLLRHLRSGSTAAAPLSHGPHQRAKQRFTVAAAFLAWLADRGHQLGECTQHDLDSWFAAGPSTRQHALTFLSWARRQRILRGADWLDVPEPVATLLRHHLCNRSNMTTAANPASPWLFPGQLAGEHRCYRRLIVILGRLGIPARASRLAAWHQLVRQAPPAVLADALGVSPDTATRHALLAGADWAAYASRRSSLATPEYEALPVLLPARAWAGPHQAPAVVSLPARRNCRLRPDRAGEVRPRAGPPLAPAASRLRPREPPTPPPVSILRSRLPQ
jgi:hypothetical protein